MPAFLIDSSHLMGKWKISSLCNITKLKISKTVELGKSSFFKVWIKRHVKEEDRNKVIAVGRSILYYDQPSPFQNKL